MAKKAQLNPYAALAQRIVARLEALHLSDPDAPAPSLRALVAQENGQVDDEAIKKVLGRKEFKDRALLVHAKDYDSPVLLKDDIERFAASTQLLDYLKTKAKPGDGNTYLVKDLQKIVGPGKGADAERLRSAFEEAVRPAIESRRLANVAFKKPTKAELAAARSSDLVKVLESQRRVGQGAYPLTLHKLARLADLNPDGDPKLVFDATKKPPFKVRVPLAWDKDLHVPVALVEDLEQLAGHPTLLESVLRSAVQKNAKCRAFKSVELAKHFTQKEKNPLFKAFMAAVTRQAHDNRLPPGIGAVPQGSKQQIDYCFFFLDDLKTGASAARPAATQVSPNPPTASHGAVTQPRATHAAAPDFHEFQRRFEAAFAELDRRHGGHNFVSLAELRRALPDVARTDFDRHLRQLRIEERFTLSGAQSRDGIPADVREAGISEAGHLLTYVSRRK
jgi:hypothetical protein